MNQIVKLSILGKLDTYIINLTRKTYVYNLAMTTDDLIQEGRLKVLELLDRYDNLPTDQLISLCLKGLNNLFRGIVRKSKFVKNTGITVDISEAWDLADKVSLNNIYFDLQLSQLMELFDDDELYVFECILEPPIPLLDLVITKYNKKSNNSTVKITRTILAEYLNIPKARLREIINNIRSKAIPVLDL